MCLAKDAGAALAPYVEPSGDAARQHLCARRLEQREPHLPIWIDAKLVCYWCRTPIRLLSITIPPIKPPAPRAPGLKAHEIGRAILDRYAP